MCNPKTDVDKPRFTYSRGAVVLPGQGKRYVQYEKIGPAASNLLVNRPAIHSYTWVSSFQKKAKSMQETWDRHVFLVPNSLSGV